MVKKAKKKITVKKVINKKDNKISVKIASLTKPLEVKRIKKGTTLDEFLKNNGMTYSSNIRVNAQVTTRDYKLKNKDIIIVVAEVSGGH